LPPRLCFFGAIISSKQKPLIYFSEISSSSCLFGTTEIFDNETAASMFRKGQVRTINLSNFRVRFWFEKKTIKTNRAAPTCNICLEENNIKISMILKEKITKISMI